MEVIVFVCPCAADASRMRAPYPSASPCRMEAASRVDEQVGNQVFGLGKGFVRHNLALDRWLWTTRQESFPGTSVGPLRHGTCSSTRE